MDEVSGTSIQSGVQPPHSKKAYGTDSKGEMTVRYKLLGKSGLRVSELCLGTMTFDEEWGFFARGIVRSLSSGGMWDQIDA